jgi:predicted nucleic acid-binding Zn ribbon protein
MRAHPLCAFLAGWNMALDHRDQVLLECCSEGLDKEKQSHRRKFILNYKKILYKA